jgi:peptidoglycan/xylan/chitin deacetylase (PgdA/CDA1 family)
MQTQTRPEQTGPAAAFGIVLFSSAPPSKLRQFLRRLATDLPELRVAGVLYEQNQKRLPLGKRLKRFFTLLPDRQFRAYVGHKLAAKVADRLTGMRDRLLRWAHAGPAHPNGQPVSLGELAQACEAAGIRFHVTDNIHAPASLDFVRGLHADLGVIYSTRILKPELFTIPARGSINIHKQQLPDYRGGGPPGIWALRDGRATTSVTVHRVLKEVDAGAVLGERTFTIDPYDTLASVRLKADLLANDLLIDVLRAESQGRAEAVPQPAGGQVFKGFKPHQLFAIEQEVRRRRPAFQPQRQRPAYKLLLRTLLYPALLVRNQLRRRRQNFPVVILFHHLISDKPKQMGLSTDQFARQVRYLKKHYRIAALPEALEDLRRGKVSAPTVVLTFDDGYAENFLCLRAVAEAEDVPVTLFVCTRKVTEQAGFDHDLVRGEVGFPALGWDQVRYLERHNVTIGSHTRTHFDCDSSDADLLTDELAGSREDLCRDLGHYVPYFAFPRGHPVNMSATAVDAAKGLYPYIFSACGGVNWVVPSLPGELYRCSQPDSLWELELLLQSVLEFRRRPAAAPAKRPPARDEERLAASLSANG